LKPSSPELRALFATRQWYAAFLFTFTLVDGTVLRFTSGDRDISKYGSVYSCGGKTGALFKGNGDGLTCNWKRGLEVDTLQFAVYPRNELMNGVPFLAACKNGAFDGAELQLERAYMPTYGDTSVGTVITFVGRIAEIDAGRSSAIFNVNSHLELLNQKMPRNLYQASCINSLYDASCTLNRESFAANGAAGSGSTATAIKASFGSQYNLGVIKFTSGANNGISRTVKSADGTTIALISPLPVVPTIGDTFRIYRGCDKTTTSCNSFSNIANFRGFPTIPVAETAS
jgi:uncharacterized phage protein (TIGR02218 family)